MRNDIRCLETKALEKAKALADKFVVRDRESDFFGLVDRRDEPELLGELACLCYKAIGKKYVCESHAIHDSDVRDLYCGIICGLGPVVAAYVGSRFPHRVTGRKLHGTSIRQQKQAMERGYRLYHHDQRHGRL